MTLELKYVPITVKFGKEDEKLNVSSLIVDDIPVKFKRDNDRCDLDFEQFLLEITFALPMLIYCQY